MKINTADTVFVFDLDDTLYKEADYHISGVQAVSSKVKQVYGFDVGSYLKTKIENGETDLWGSLCNHFKLPATVKDSLIWEYRLHTPDIKLSDSTKSLLSWLEEKSAGVAILTDGRSITQRLKINALGLAYLPAFISDEYGEVKPDPVRFKSIERQYPNKKYIYIADNLAKDFLAPNELGWTTFGLKDDGHNIHPQNITNFDQPYLPDYWLLELEELKEFIC